MLYNNVTRKSGTCDALQLKGRTTPLGFITRPIMQLVMCTVTQRGK